MDSSARLMAKVSVAKRRLDLQGVMSGLTAVGFIDRLRLGILIFCPSFAILRVYGEFVK